MRGRVVSCRVLIARVQMAGGFAIVFGRGGGVLLCGVVCWRVGEMERSWGVLSRPVCLTDWLRIDTIMGRLCDDRYVWMQMQMQM